MAELLEGLERQVFAGPVPATERLRAILRALQGVTVRRLMLAAEAPSQSVAVRADIEAVLARRQASLSRASRAGDPADRGVAALLARDIERHLTRPSGVAAPGAPPEAPAGPPIGGWGLTDECSAFPRSPNR